MLDYQALIVDCILLSGMTPSSDLSLNESPFLVVEEPMDSFFNESPALMMTNNGNAKDEFSSKSCITRWKHIQRLFIVYPSDVFQGYVAKRLDVPHYHVLASEYPRWLYNVNLFQASKSNALFNVIHCTRDQDWCNDFLVVKNSEFDFSKVPADIPNSKQPKEFVADLLSTVLLEKSSADTSRNNIYLDSGFCSDRNSYRDGSLSDGVARPRLLRATMDIQIMRLAMVWMSRVCGANLHLGKAGSSFRRIYSSNLERHRCFAGMIHPDNDIESFRVGITNQVQGLSCHVDRHNDTHPDYSPTYGFVTYVYHEEIWYRVALIAYSRASIGRSLGRSNRFGKIVKEVNVYYKNELFNPSNRFRVSLTEMALLHNKVFHSGKDIPVTSSLSRCLSEYWPTEEEKNWLPFVSYTLRLPPCFDKAAFLSPMVHVGVLMSSKYNLNADQMCGILFNFVTSESPDWLYSSCYRFLNNQSNSFEMNKSTGAEIGIFIYHEIHDLRRTKQSPSQSQNDKPGRTTTETRGQRHQPCNNRMATDLQITESVNNLMSLVIACAGRVEYDLQLFSHASRILCLNSSLGGVHGGGPFTSQHILVGGALMGLFPPQFCQMAEISPSTDTFRSIMADYNLGEVPVDDLSPCTSENFYPTDKLLLQLMDCLQHSLRTSHEEISATTSARTSHEQISTTSSAPAIHMTYARVENILCEFGRWKRNNDDKYKDSVYMNQHFYMFNLQSSCIESIDPRQPLLTKEVMKSTQTFRTVQSRALSNSVTVAAFWRDKSRLRGFKSAQKKRCVGTMRSKSRNAQRRLYQLPTPMQIGIATEKSRISFCMSNVIRIMLCHDRQKVPSEWYISEVEQCPVLCKPIHRVGIRLGMSERKTKDLIHEKPWFPDPDFPLILPDCGERVINMDRTKAFSHDKKSITLLPAGYDFFQSIER